MARSSRSSGVSEPGATSSSDPAADPPAADFGPDSSMRFPASAAPARANPRQYAASATGNRSKSRSIPGPINPAAGHPVARATPTAHPPDQSRWRFCRISSLISTRTSNRDVTGHHCRLAVNCFTSIINSQPSIYGGRRAPQLFDKRVWRPCKAWRPCCFRDPSRASEPTQRAVGPPRLLRLPCRRR